MTIGELFISLGIKGSDKAVNALKDVKKGLGETASMGIATKAAIVGAVYALERLFAASGAMGTSLTNFNALTGLSTKQLQQWQYAARQAGVSNEEFTGSLKAVQTGMTNMLLGKGAPEGLAMLANKVGFDPTKARDTFYVMQQMQKFAMTAPADVGNSVLKSFGASEGTIAAMRRGAFNKSAFGKAPTYSDQEVGQLDKANIAWSNLGNKIQMAVGHFNAQHGGQMVKDLSMLTDKVIILVNALLKLADALKLFPMLGKVVEGAASVAETTAGVAGNDTIYKKRFQQFQDHQKEMKGKEPIVRKWLREHVSSSFGKLPYAGQSAISPTVRGGPANGAQGPKVEINQNLHFQHDGKDHKKTGDSVKKANQDAFRQFNQGQVN